MLQLGGASRVPALFRASFVCHSKRSTNNIPFSGMRGARDTCRVVNGSLRRRWTEVDGGGIPLLLEINIKTVIFKYWAKIGPKSNLITGYYLINQRFWKLFNS